MSAKSLACSGVRAISPLGTLTPYLLKIPMLRCSCSERCLLHNTAGPFVTCTVDKYYIIHIYILSTVKVEDIMNQHVR